MGMAELIIFLLFLLLPSSEPTDVVPGVEEVIANYEDALGGRDALDAISTIEVFGRIEGMGLTGTTYSVQKAPDMVMEKVNIGPLSYSWAHSDEDGWMMDQSGTVRSLSGTELDELLLLSKVAGGSPIDDELLGLMKVSQILSDEVFVCILLGEEDQPIELYFNRQNGLLEKVHLKKMGMPIEATFSDFREVEGTMIPFKSIQSVAGAFGLVVDVDSLHVNIPVSDNVFVRPSSVMHVGENPLSCVMPVKVGQHILVPVMINENTPVHFFLDTGAGMSCISREYASRLGLETHGALPAQGVVGYDSVAITSIDSLDSGCFHSKETRLAVVDLSLLLDDKGKPVDGILGYGFFSKLIVAHYGNSDSLILSSSMKQVAAEGFFELPLEFIANVPVIEAEVNGHHGQFLVDTGNSFDLIIHTPFAVKEGILPPKEKLVPMSAASIGGASEIYAGVVDSLVIGKTVLKDVRALFSPRGIGVTAAHEVSGNIGLPVLKRFDWIMDYRGGKLYLRSRTKEGS